MPAHRERHAHDAAGDEEREARDHLGARVLERELPVGVAAAVTVEHVWHIRVQRAHGVGLRFDLHVPVIHLVHEPERGEERARPDAPGDAGRVQPRRDAAQRLERRQPERGCTGFGQHGGRALGEPFQERRRRVRERVCVRHVQPPGAAERDRGRHARRVLPPVRARDAVVLAVAQRQERAQHRLAIGGRERRQEEIVQLVHQVGLRVAPLVLGDHAADRRVQRHRLPLGPGVRLGHARKHPGLGELVQQPRRDLDEELCKGSGRLALRLVSHYFGGFVLQS